MNQTGQFPVRTSTLPSWIFLHARHYGDHVDKHAVHGYCAQVGERTLWGYCETSDSLSPMALGAARALKSLGWGKERKVELVVKNGGLTKYLDHHAPQWLVHNVNRRNSTPEAYEAWQYLVANRHRFFITKLNGRSDFQRELKLVRNHLKHMEIAAPSAIGKYRLISADETYDRPIS